MKFYLFLFVYLLNLFGYSQPGFSWAKQLTGTNNYCVPKSTAIDNKGNIYIVGQFLDTVDFDPGVGVYNLVAHDYEAFVLKLSPQGSLLWVKAFISNRPCGGDAIAVDSRGYVYSTGYFLGTCDFDPGLNYYNLNSTLYMSADVFVSKLDSLGNFVWAKNMGGTLNDYAYSMAIDFEGNVYTTGQFESNDADFNPGPGTFIVTTAGMMDGFISKLDSSGNFVWAKQIGGVNQDYSNSLGLDHNNHVYTTGYFSGTVDFDPGPGITNLISIADAAYVSKLDANGNFVWVKAFDGASNYDRGFALDIDMQGNVLTSGIFSDSVDFDPGINNYMLYSLGPRNYLSKLDSMGNFMWARILAGNVQSIVSGANGNVYTTGFFMNTCDFDPSPSTHIMTVPASFVTQAFICEFDRLGNFICAGQIGSNAVGKAINLDQNNIIVTGNFSHIGDFNPGSGIFNLTPRLNTNTIFVSKLTACSQIMHSNEFGIQKEYNIFPNPSTGVVTVNMPSTADSNICVYDLLGNYIQTKSCSNEVYTQIDLSSQSKGIYFIHIISDNEKVVKKVVLQ